VRIALTPREPLHCDFFNITVANPSALFREQFRCLPNPKEAAAKQFRDERSISDLFDILSAVCRALDDRDRVFDQRREEVVQAYWTLRQTFPDKQLDLDIARSAEAPIFCTHLRHYLWRVSAARS
jgi:hypothetical protein